MTNEPQEEKVLVIPTEWFRRLGYFQGFTGDMSRYLPGLFAPDKISFRPRRQVELDASFKQLIPYVVFCHECDGRWHIFSYSRGTGQGEERLHCKRSIGVGGHISQEDARSDGDLFEQGLRRELHEEISINTPYTLTCVGLINDDETEVGSVHLGVVYQCRVVEPAVLPRESEIVSHGFAPVEELANNWYDFETWSQITLEGVFGVHPPKR